MLVGYAKNASCVLNIPELFFCQVTSKVSLWYFLCVVEKRLRQKCRLCVPAAAGLNMIFTLLQAHVVHEVLDLLFVFLLADQEDAIGFHDNEIIKALNDRQLVIG